MKPFIKLMVCCGLLAAMAGCTKPSGLPLHTLINPGFCCYPYQYALQRQQSSLNLSFSPAFMEFDRGIHRIKNPTDLRKMMQEFLGEKTEEETVYAMSLHGISCRTKSAAVFGKNGRSLDYLACSTADTLSPVFIRRWEMKVFFKGGTVADVLVNEAER